MSASDYLEAKIINHLLRSDTFAKPGNIGIALFTTMPDEDGTGGVEVSTSGTAYARANYPPSDSLWDAPTDTGTVTNIDQIIFGVPTDDWGEVVGFGIYDDLTAGNLLIMGTLDTPREIFNGDLAPRFEPGTLSVIVS